jgi:hypothetical protein
MRRKMAALTVDHNSGEEPRLGMRTFLTHTPIIGIWDAHDFGENDAGRDDLQK